MSDQIVLEASKRETLGKKVKAIRREGQVPAIVYGPGNDPLPIQMDHKELRNTLIHAGGTQLIDLKIGKEKISVLAREVQRDIIRGDILHVDFYRVSLDRVISAEVPVVLFNEPEIVTGGMAFANLLLPSVLIEALPLDLPAQLEVDISGLIEIGDQLLIGDLDLPSEVIALGDPEEVLVKIDYAVSLEVEEEEEEEELFEPSAEDVEVISERKEEDFEE